ncbi:hypothetical protein PVAP13_5NG572333 [Panicum virgatum]|uniref:Uncharacterized protein n=1 Tax=Panicum virgatum TaxID=38727 RepID=A0A8T0S7E1_PANVG|nr:hypothetical protein PVAP13_5NG572333 [Panicum virgatum]
MDAPARRRVGQRPRRSPPGPHTTELRPRRGIRIAHPPEPRRPFLGSRIWAPRRGHGWASAAASRGCGGAGGEGRRRRRFLARRRRRRFLARRRRRRLGREAARRRRLLGPEVEAWLGRWAGTEGSRRRCRLLGAEVGRCRGAEVEAQLEGASGATAPGRGLATAVVPGRRRARREERKGRG